VALFVWTEALGRIQTLDNLRKRHLLVMGLACAETVGNPSIEHLLLHCGVGRELWVSLFCLFGVKWVMPNRGGGVLG
jgi:hypothetical protein